MGCGDGELRKGDKIMSEKGKPRRDPFTFSLLGLKTMAAYTTAGAIAHDRINRAWDEKLRQAQENQPADSHRRRSTGGRFWLSRRHGTA